MNSNPNLNLNLLYVAFDVVPAPKGAAVHIEHFTRALALKYASLKLVTTAPGNSMSTTDVWPGVTHVQIPALGNDLISRVMHFRKMFAVWLQNQQQHFDVVHFRSPFEGFWLCLEKERYCHRLIYEVNGLPSIELKYRYPNVADDEVLLTKLRHQEQICLSAADSIITTCSVTQRYLATRDVPSTKITVIPNGVQLETFSFAEPITFHPDKSGEPLRLIYFGTLSAWQGIDFAIRAVALACREGTPTELTIIGPAADGRRHDLIELAGSLQIADMIKILPPMPQQDLVASIHKSHAVLVPLTCNDRNLVQGCSPLKVLEGMATGRAVIASDLPVVREIGDDSCLVLAKANSTGSWRDKFVELRSGAIDMNGIARKARTRIEQNYTWSHATEQLLTVYESTLCTKQLHTGSSRRFD